MELLEPDPCRSQAAPTRLPTGGGVAPGFLAACEGSEIMNGCGGSNSGDMAIEELMERYVDGDGAAFEVLYRFIASRLIDYLTRLTRDRARAEDLLQLTFWKVHRARSAYLPGAPVLPWIFTIARHCFCDERRRARVRYERLSFDGSLPDRADGNSGPMPIDARLVLAQALDSLPQAYREAIQLTKITGFSVAEAAFVLGASPTAIKLRVHRGYRLLRVELAVADC